MFVRVLPGPVAAVLLTPQAHAHSPFVAGADEQLAVALGAVVLVLFWLMYLIGSWRLPPLWRSCLAFHGASALAAFTLFGPLDHWAESSAAAHMTQHMVMMVVIAPLWVLAQPLPQFRAVSAPVTHRVWRAVLTLARYPMAAAFLHGAVIWFWHAPKLYVLALENEWWHVVEHACFLVTAGIFWWAVLRASRRKTPEALLALLFTLMHTGFLGALLTFAQAPLYGAERSLQSQQLAGLLMWVMGGLPYLAASAWMGARWFRQLIRHSASATALDEWRK